MKYLVLSVDRFEFTDEKTGRTVSGASAWTVNDYREESADSAGFKPTKLSISEELFPSFKSANLPAMFEVEFTTKPGKDGKPALVVKEAKVLNQVNLFNQVKKV